MSFDQLDNQLLNRETALFQSRSLGIAKLIVGTAVRDEEMAARPPQPLHFKRRARPEKLKIEIG